MKLKALKPRLHNIIFHTHTVSGIVISFALFVIFYAGAVALFMDELYQWENPTARVEAVNPATVNYDGIVELVKKEIPDFDTSQQFGIRPPTEIKPLITFYGSLKTKNDQAERFTAYINPVTKALHTRAEPLTHMSQTIYELHYFKQIPTFGIYLSGLVAFFFLFAVFTGVLTHWKNIVSKFYAFTIKGKWKQIWVNGHISLGVITLPFQIIYAITGALLGLSILLLAPTAFLVYDGDTDEVIKVIRPDAAMKYDENAKGIDNSISFNSVYAKVSNENPKFEVSYLYSRNYQKEDGTLTAVVGDHKGLGSDGTFVYSLKDGSLINAVHPETKPYSLGTLAVLIKLHYATFGGLFLKIIYFILAMITCYIIISGVMIWRTARDNKKYTDKQRRFHHRVTKFYLAITLSMFPAIALIFIANKLVPMETVDRTFYVDAAFFLGWSLLTITGLFWNDYRKLNRNYLLTGSILGLFIPVVNGIITGDWIWKTLVNEQYYVFSVDLTWIVIGISGLLICRYYLHKKPLSKKRISSKIVQESKAGSSPKVETGIVK
ncbi:PepSY-associated TM helix domain-containing protein [Ascidiimonas aurantiaca]|uniref:PepSY-associated TM helix domain-containing protein n=1 Tax=Ascidiimonas aurantiaca TaxID=1685432 RepID=UPI0030EB2421